MGMSLTGVNFSSVVLSNETILFFLVISPGPYATKRNCFGPIEFKPLN